MALKTFSCSCPEYYDLYLTCHAHGWKSLAPFSWDDDTGCLRFAVITEEIPVDIACRQVNGSIRVHIFSQVELTAAHIKRIRNRVRRSLGLDFKTDHLLQKAEKAGPEYAELVRKGAGRLLRSPTLWEDAAKTLFTTNCSWSLTRKMCKAMCSEHFSPPAPSGAHPFPHPQTIAAYSSEQLRAWVPVGYRADYLKALAERFSEDPGLDNLEENGYDYRSADRIVRNLKGFADYACAHLLVMAGYCEKIPVDTTVISFLKKNYRVRKPKSFVARHYRKWGSDQWWGYKLDRMVARQNWIGD